MAFEHSSLESLDVSSFIFTSVSELELITCVRIEGSTNFTEFDSGLVDKLLDCTQLEELQSDLKLFSGLVPLESLKRTGLDVLELIVKDLGRDSVTVVTIGESLEHETSLGSLLFKSDTEANTFSKRLESKTGSFGVPITTTGSIDHWVGCRETSSFDISLLVEFDLTRVSDGHDTVITDWDLDLYWVDGSFLGVSWFESSIGSDSQIPFKPSREGVGFGQPDSMHEEGLPLFELITTFIILDSRIGGVESISLKFLNHWVVELIRETVLDLSIGVRGSDELVPVSLVNGRQLSSRSLVLVWKLISKSLIR